MKQVNLIRAWQDHRVTLGMIKIVDADHRPLYTLENPWMHNEPNVSCIPPGEYVCTPYSGTHYKNVYKLCHVPGRTDILIHWGNWEKNTQGCILLGTGSGIMKDEPAVSNSMEAVNLFRGIIGKEDFILRIHQG